MPDTKIVVLEHGNTSWVARELKDSILGPHVRVCQNTDEFRPEHIGVYVLGGAEAVYAHRRVPLNAPMYIHGLKSGCLEAPRLGPREPCPEDLRRQLLLRAAWLLGMKLSEEDLTVRAAAPVIKRIVVFSGDKQARSALELLRKRGMACPTSVLGNGVPAGSEDLLLFSPPRTLSFGSPWMLAGNRVRDIVPDQGKNAGALIALNPDAKLSAPPAGFVAGLTDMVSRHLGVVVRQERPQRNPRSSGGRAGFVR